MVEKKDSSLVNKSDLDCPTENPIGQIANKLICNLLSVGNLFKIYFAAVMYKTFNTEK